MGVASSDALRSAAVAARVAGPEAVVVLPAGAHDHYVAAPDAVPELIAPGTLTVALAGRESIAVGVPADLVGDEAVRRGEDALEGGLLDERQDDGVTLSEWADRIDAALDGERVTVRIEPVGETDRRIDVFGVGDAGRRYVAAAEAHRTGGVEAR